jgi:hypothetical protein
MSNGNRPPASPYGGHGCIRSAGILPAFFRAASQDKIAGKMPALRSTIYRAIELIAWIATVGFAGRRTAFF